MVAARLSTSVVLLARTFRELQQASFRNLAIDVDTRLNRLQGIILSAINRTVHDSTWKHGLGSRASNR